jgi:peptidoglycan/LPS O-acetylase OafA/YrhL
MSSGKSLESLEGGGFAARAGHLSRVDNHVNMRLLSADVPYANGIPEQIISSLVWNGQRGVQIFFAVSGFLITSTTLRRWGMLKAVNLRALLVDR